MALPAEEDMEREHRRASNPVRALTVGLAGEVRNRVEALADALDHADSPEALRSVAYAIRTLLQELRQPLAPIRARLEEAARTVEDWAAEPPAVSAEQMAEARDAHQRPDVVERPQAPRRDGAAGELFLEAHRIISHPLSAESDGWWRPGLLEFCQRNQARLQEYTRARNAGRARMGPGGS
jgi:hypothetical protein